MIQSAIIDAALNQASSLLGLGLVRTSSRSKEFDFEVRLTTLPEPKGMYLSVADDYLAWTCSLRMDDLSRRLVEVLIARSVSNSTFSDLVDEMRARFPDFVLNTAPSENLEGLPGQHPSFEISFSLPFDQLSPGDALVELLIWAFSLPIALIYESDEKLGNDVAPIEGELEGAVSKATFNRYERSRKNRAMCLRHYGFICAACGEEMSSKYGMLGAEVIHVHHISPISQMGSPERIDPIKDLVPLCPNCHNVVHQKNPPVPVFELRNYLRGIADAENS